MFFKDRRTQGSGVIKTLPLLPLRDLVVLPHAAVSFIVGRQKSIAAMALAQRTDREVFLATQLSPDTSEPSDDDVHMVGTISAVIQVMRLPDNTQRVLVDGRRRGRILKFINEGQYTRVEVEELPELSRNDSTIEVQMRSTRQLFEEYARSRNNIPVEMVLQVNGIDDPTRLGYALARHISGLKTADRQALLELDDPGARLDRLNDVLRNDLEILAQERRSKPKSRRPELRPPETENGPPTGDKDEFRSEMLELEGRINERDLPPEAQERAQRELRKLKLMSPMSAEATVVRNYLDWILALPWGPPPPNAIDLGLAEQVLNEDHRGLRKVKDRILEHLAVLKRVEHLDGPILCLVGPPGVGKTSLAKSIARAMNRPFVRIALGGVRDEAEVRGHRRTYIGAMPGRIIQGMRRAAATNPVFLLDEIDKMSSDFRGDPSSAMLEVLDPEQNKAFVDHYLDLDYNLSDVLFICTANTLEGIPIPLQDRLEIVRLSGYTDVEKLSIAMHHLVPRQLKAHGLSATDVHISVPAVQRVIQAYTREAGVRTLEREIATICRKVARKVVAREEQPEASVLATPIQINAQRVERLLGVPRHRGGSIGSHDACGFVNGLAWTSVGGVMVPIEAAVVPGTGKITLTGKLGDIFRESAQAAVTYMRSRAEALGLARDFWEHLDLHIHIPELWGVDGPSAGITLATAVVSAACQIPVRRDVAMTGEITLRGRVRPIGGLKEKLLAAHQAGITCVLIPADNAKDLRDVPKTVREALSIIQVEHMDDVLRLALAASIPTQMFEKPVEGTLAS